MEHEEWKIIYENYYKSLYLYALSLTGSPSDAEDILQETFVKAYLSYEEKGSLKAWLVTVLKNEFLSLQRRRKKETIEDEAILTHAEPIKEDALSTIIKKEERRQLFMEIQKLPLRMREILMESIYLNMSDMEIAKIHQLSHDNVRKIKSRAKEKLVEQMKNKRGNSNE